MRLSNRTKTLSKSLVFCLGMIYPMNAAGQIKRNAVDEVMPAYKELRVVGSSKQKRGVEIKKGLGDHYLLLVNTAIASMVNDEKLTQFDKSPYDGIAVAFWHAYDTSEVIPAETMTAKLAHWKEITKKHIWPWIYVNRLIGADPAGKNSYSNVAYFQGIGGADLEGKFGARSEFLQNWGNSLRAARRSGAPGVVCDLEFYNFYGEYGIDELSHQIGTTPARSVALLEKLGTEMVDIAAKEYPVSTLWLLFTGYTHPGYKIIEQQPYYPSPTYIAQGILKEIQAKNLSLKVLSGGEGSLAYCHGSLTTLRQKIQDRSIKFAPMLAQFSNILELTGVLTLYSDRSELTGWVRTDCSPSEASKLEELGPYLELLLKTYRYNWIYGTTEGGYQAFTPGKSERFDALIRKSQKATSSPTLH
jgi:hypothetical protein